MPLLNQLENTVPASEVERRGSIFHPRFEPQPGGVLASCANPECSSGWLHLLRSRSAPVFEGGWTCSASCTLTRVESAVRRELDGRASDAGNSAMLAHRHRVPLGLVLLQQGWINQEQLRKALAAQRQAGQGRLGSWLIRQGSVSEQQITRALGLQWNCPVLHAETLDIEAMSVTLPRLFIEAYGALPLRIAGGKILYLGFEERLDPAVAFGLEQMLGLQVEMGLVAGSQFTAAQKRLIASTFPRAELVESATEAPLARVLARALERRKPTASRLVRVHDCLWLRMWHKAGPTQSNGATVEDMICSLVPH